MNLNFSSDFLFSTRRMLGGFLIVFGMTLPAGGLQAESETDGLYLNAALAFGTYNPDQEPRQFGDLVGATFFFGGFGFATEWQDKEYASIPLSVRFDLDRWRLFSDSEVIGIRPSYVSYANFNEFDYEGKDASSTVFQQVQFDPVVRSTSTTGLAVRLNGDASHRRFHLFAGYRGYRVRYFYSSLQFNDVDISQNFTSGGTAFAWGGNVSEIETAFDSVIAYRAGGAVWGITHSEDLTDDLELRFRLGFYNLSGRAVSTRQSLSIFNGSSTLTATSSGASVTAAEDEIHYNFRQDTAKLFVNGNELDLALYYKIEDGLKLFTRLSSATSRVQDSEVQVLLFTTNSDADPYTNTVNGETLYSLTARYTYPGSTAPESVGALAFGIEKRF